MKTFIAYTLVIIGIPCLVGLLASQILTMPIAMIRGIFRRPTDEAAQAQEFSAATAWSIRGSIKMPIADRIVHICMDVFNGLGSVLAAGFIFHLLGLPPTVFILFILVAWQVFFTVAFKQAFRALFGDLAGIIIGWLVILKLFSAT